MATNNKAVITFNRDFILDDKLTFNLQTFGIGGFLEFVWKSSPSVAFEVEIGTPTATTGERTAINFKTAWDNSVTGGTYVVTQSTNTVTIVADEDTTFLSIFAQDSSGNSYLTPTDYQVVLSTEVSGGFPITYDDKVTLNPITGDRINKWISDDANEVKNQHNANNDRINQNVTDIATNTTNIATNTSDIATNTSNIALKANLAGGNTFTGVQNFNDNVDINAFHVF